MASRSFFGLLEPGSIGDVLNHAAIQIGRTVVLPNSPHTPGLCFTASTASGSLMRDRVAIADGRSIEGQTGSIQTCQHTETGRNIHIEGKTGDFYFYAQDGRLTYQNTALDRAMPTGRTHSQQDEL